MAEDLPSTSVKFSNAAPAWKNKQNQQNTVETPSATPSLFIDSERKEKKLFFFTVKLSSKYFLKR